MQFPIFNCDAGTVLTSLFLFVLGFFVRSDEHDWPDFDVTYVIYVNVKAGRSVMLLPEFFHSQILHSCHSYSKHQTYTACVCLLFHVG